MATLFFDTSALVRRYDAAEPGARRVETLCAPTTGNTLIVVRLASVEVASALSRKYREGAFDANARHHVWYLFQEHWRHQYVVVSLTNDIYQLAERLLFAHVLRSYDALHLGSALVVSAALRDPNMVFCTADQRQALVAEREGLDVELIA